MRLEHYRTSLALALACVGLALLPERVSSVLALERQALFAGQWWRLWCGHLVHFGLQHAATDAIVLFACGAILERQGGAGRLGLHLLLAAPLLSVFLLLAAPGMMEYRGASALATMLAGAAGMVLWADARRRPALLLAAFAFGTWTLAQAMDVGASLAGLPSGIEVAWQAHLAGALCALPSGLALRGRHHRTEYQSSRHES